jgi:AcrR family transcriptional regulator
MYRSGAPERRSGIQAHDSGFKAKFWRRHLVRFAARPSEGPSLAERAAHRSTAALVASRADEAQRLMDAGLAVMERNGTDRRPTVSEIVREAGLSNQAFYRYFESKDDLIAAIVDAGARRLVGYLQHRMSQQDDAADQVRAWVAGVLSQSTNPKVAAPTRAVMWNRSGVDAEAEDASRRADSMVWALLEEPLVELGSADPTGQAYLIGKLVIGVQVEALWAEPPPTPKEVDSVADFCLAAVRSIR